MSTVNHCSKPLIVVLDETYTLIQKKDISLVQKIKMFQLIQQDNVFERREPKVKEEVSYYAGLPGQFKDEKAMYEVDIPTDTEEQGTDQCDSKDLLDVFAGLAAGDFARSHRNFYQKYGQHKELSQYV